jgi:uncharacterized YigZ family protein
MFLLNSLIFKPVNYTVDMSDTGIIKTLREPAESIYKEKGSEFIAKAFPVKTEDEVQKILNKIKKKYYDASHHCYAFRLKDDTFRYSDAGEPTGTAGIRILNAIDHFQITDILIIVIRYFGGIKLGVGSLGKTYYISSELLLKKCIYQEEKPFRKITIISGFNFIGIVHRIISNHSAIIENTSYSEEITFECLIPEQYLTKLEQELTDSSNGNIKIHRGEEKIYHSF